ncbi:non-ribosomal peptide synthetase [Anaerosporobacter faecicola]|uniref:non-ribosomal peptide synthetase n=1 Tax=Anaerosporobacter faecicola TaxID=2718714 RepID=UPI00143AE7E5|nr:non-ribosomal peptide synthetase [Anaerosporobacter faecicola]
MAKGAKIQNIYPLTPMQQGMLFHSLYNKKSKAYFQQLYFTIEADLNMDVFENSVNTLIERYDAFRTIFVYEKVEEPKQVVLEKRTLKVVYEDISQWDDVEKNCYLENYKNTDFSKGFDLTKDLLMRVAVFRIAPREYQIIWSHHHIIMDGWCLGVVLKEFIQTYQAKKVGKEGILPHVFQYVDYINWLGKQDHTMALQYWRTYLAGYEDEVYLPTRSDRSTDSYEKGENTFSLDQETSTTLQMLCKKTNVTLNNVFQAVWAILLQRYSNTDDVVFGAVVSGRNAPVNGIEHMVGLFINTIPIRVTCNDTTSFVHLLESIRDNYNQSIRYDFLSLAKIQNVSPKKQDLIKSLMIFENYPMSDYTSNDTYRIKEAHSFEQTNYDLNLVIKPADEISIKIKYNKMQYDPASIEGMKSHLLAILHKISYQPECLLKEISLLSIQEHEQLFDTQTSHIHVVQKEAIPTLFTQQVRKAPDQIAVIFNDKQITYGELQKQTDQVSYELRKLGVKRESCVAMITERSLEMIIGIFAIIKAGGAYVPIDPSYPKERIQYMLQDCNANVLLTNVDVQDLHYQGQVLDLREISPSCEISLTKENSSSADDLAYVIYTSGTTGKPKGVMIQQESVINLVKNIDEKIYKKLPNLRIALLAPYVFDASIKQIFPALLTGQTLVIVPEEERMNGEKLVAYYCKHHVSISDGTPAHLSILKEVLQSSKQQLPVRQFLIGGEELTIDLVREFFSVYDRDDLTITNVYGPTECCDVATMFTVNAHTINQYMKIPIGHPLNQVQVYLLDKNQNPVPYEIPGEIYIAGDGVGRGYLGQIDKTQERFSPDPFVTDGTMYRTGDLGRRLRTGEIEYLGRADEQVKIRGYRIELEEVANQIREVTQKEVAVLSGTHKTGSKFLIAFIKTTENISSEILKQSLSRTLPYYMIPTYIHSINEFPITHNGKIDKKRLLEQFTLNDQTTSIQNNTISQEPVEGEVLLTPIQKNFFERDLQHKEHWNQGICLYRKEGFEVAIVTKVFDYLTKHHDALRMHYEERNETIVQYNAGINEKAFHLLEYTCTEQEKAYAQIKQIANELQNSIHLAAGPLVQLGLFHTSSGDHLLILVHHLVIDGVSWRILLEDFVLGYTQLLQKEAICLPLKTTSFKEWAEQLQQYSNTEIIRTEYSYWKSMLQVPTESISGDYPVTTRQFKDIRTEDLLFTTEETNALLKRIHSAYGTQTEEILLAILSLTMKEWKGVTKLLINMEGHGREEIRMDNQNSPNIKRTIGWFTTFYPLIISSMHANTLAEHIKEIQTSLRNVPNKGIGYGLLRYQSNLTDTEKEQLFCRPEINFNYLGQFTEEVENEAFTLSDAPIGSCVNEQDQTGYVLNIIAKVVHHQLAISIKFCNNEFTTDSIHEWQAIFYKNAIALMKHCMEQHTQNKGEENQVTPRNQIEQDLVHIWERVLQTESIGIYDDFFQLGGDSISAIKILSKANNQKIPISVKAILEYRTIANILSHCMPELYAQTTGQQESATTRQLDISLAEQTDRRYNIDFHVTEEYPSYYGCMTGVILEKLKHERNIFLERSFLAVGGGKSNLTYGHVNNRGCHMKLQYRELPTELLPEQDTIFSTLHVTETVKSFPDLAAGLAYCEEHLRSHELVMISGTTYYLNYTPDYCIGEETWRKRLDVRPENNIAVTEQNSGRAHTFLLVDIQNDSYLVYDTTFHYYGWIPAEDFHKSFAGLRGMDFMNGTYAQQTNLAYAVTELDLRKINHVDNQQIGLAVLQNTITTNLSNKRVDIQTKDNVFTFYVGIRVFREIAAIIEENPTYPEEHRKLLQDCFGSWRYKFLFLQELLEDLQHYMVLAEECLPYCKTFIMQCDQICDRLKTSLNSKTCTFSKNYVSDLCDELERIYKQQDSFFHTLQRMVDESLLQKGDGTNG